MGKNEGSNPLSKSNTRRILKDFCGLTSLHGYGYIYNNDSIALKLFWLFIILIMTGLGILFLVTNTMAFLEHKVYTTTETSSAPISVSSTIFALEQKFALFFNYESNFRHLSDFNRMSL